MFLEFWNTSLINGTLRLSQTMQHTQLIHNNMVITSHPPQIKRLLIQRFKKSNSDKSIVAISRVYWHMRTQLHRLIGDSKLKQPTRYLVFKIWWIGRPFITRKNSDKLDMLLSTEWLQTKFVPETKNCMGCLDAATFMTKDDVGR